jgi:hypothetical protein
MTWRLTRVAWSDAVANDDLQREGWEPFSVGVDALSATYIYYRRKVDAEGNPVRDAS